MSGHNWAFSQLAPSPGTTPDNGPTRDRTDDTLSFPCDSNALQAQLEQWTNVAFEFDSPDFADSTALANPDSDSAKHLGSTIPAAAAAASPTAGADERNRYAARVGEFGFKPLLVHDHAEPHVQPTVDLSALLASSSAQPAGSLVDPALSLPSFASAAPALPPSFFAPETPASAAAPLDLVSPAQFDAAPSPAASSSAGTVSSSTSAAKKAKGASSSSSGAASKKKRAPSAAVAAKLASAAKTLPLPEGVDPSSLNEDELNRLAIEEDKRRRNTAASARFRVKKKQREQELEQTAKELRERVAGLEKEVDTLKTENGWLRSLVVDKSVNTGRNGADNTRKRAREDDLESSILV
ncbi:hypothetical protein JCM3775_001414 [Rhodotorula graminis]